MCVFCIRKVTQRAIIGIFIGLKIDCVLDAGTIRPRERLELLLAAGRSINFFTMTLPTFLSLGA